MRTTFTERSGATAILAVGALAFVLAAAQALASYAPHTWIHRDARFYTNVNVTLIERGSVDQGEFCASWYEGQLGWNRNLDQAWSNVALGRDGRHLPKHSMLLPLLSTPLFWAFHLHGTLLFNLLVLGLVGAFGFAVARRYVDDAPAALAALALPLATGLRSHTYDYSVDPLILAFFLAAWAALAHRRGLAAGVAFAVAVVLRPTSLIWLPSILLLWAERRDRRLLLHAVLGALGVFVLFAAANTWLFGRPWWSGYNRVLVVVDGVPTLDDHADAFGIPLGDGLRALWDGPEGVRTRLTVMGFALPGLFVLGRRRPLYALAAIVGVALSVLVFAQYRWYGHRFLAPSGALLLPALAVTFSLASRAWPARWRPGLRAPVALVLIALAHAVAGPPLEHRFEGGRVEDLFLHLGWLALFALGFASFAGAFVRPALAALAPVLLLLMPGVPDRVLAGGSDLIFAALVALALAALVRAPRLVGRARWLAILVAVSAPLGALLVLEPAAFEVADLVTGLVVGEGRATLAVAALAALGVLALALRAGSWARRAAAILLLVAPLVALFVPAVASLGGGRLPLFASALLMLGALVLVTELAARAMSTWRASTPQGRRLLALAPFVVLFALGLGPRLGESPFRLASYEAVRGAEVHLGDIPCDFLAWEHLNWECATFDRGVHAQTGLATSAPLEVGGERAVGLLITTSGARPRRVRWEGIRASPRFVLRYALPDGRRPVGVLEVRVDGHRIARLPVGRAGREGWQQVHLATGLEAGAEASLELELHGSNAAVLIEGGFEGVQ